jgi:hypothetical protein
VKTAVHKLNFSSLSVNALCALASDFANAPPMIVLTNEPATAPPNEAPRPEPPAGGVDVGVDIILFFRN